MKRAVAVIIIIVVVGSLAASNASATQAPQAATAVNPLKQVLQRSDFPTRATYESELGLDSYLRTPLKAAGLSGYAGRYLGVTYSKTKGLLQVTGAVITVADAPAARKAFAIVRTARVKYMRDPNSWRPLTLPRYGDEQAARINPPGAEGIGFVELIVRRNRVVWLLHVTLERRPKPPVTEIVADARTYAAKQQRRVGAG